MNIYEIREKTGISISKLRKLENLKVNFAKLDPEPGTHELAAAIRFHFGRHEFPTVTHALAMIATPDIVEELKGYRKRAQVEMARLGDVRSQAAPDDVIAQLEDAAAGDADAVQIVGKWVRSVLTDRAVPYHYLAVRLLIGLPPKMQEKAHKHLTFVFMHIRQAFPDLWFKSEKNVIFYKLPLDL